PCLAGAIRPSHPCPTRRSSDLEASHQVVVAAARADSGPCSRDEDLEMDPRVVIEPPHLAEIVHDVRGLDYYTGIHFEILVTGARERKRTPLNSRHIEKSYAAFC